MSVLLFLLGLALTIPVYKLAIGLALVVVLFAGLVGFLVDLVSNPSKAG